MTTSGTSSEHFTISDTAAGLHDPLSGWDAVKIHNAKVLVVGAGALGNEVLKNLALIGIKKIFLVDFDRIERTNLAKSVLYREADCTGTTIKVDKAKERLLEIMPDMRIITLNGDITIDVGAGIFREVDVIVSCLDNRLARLWVNRLSFQQGKPWVDGGILELGGQVDVYRPEGNCYECGLGEKALENIAYRNGCINRMRRYATAGLTATNILSASVVGAVQTMEALKLVASPQKTLAGKQFYFDGHANFYDTLGKATPLRKGCASHKAISDSIEAAELSAKSTVGEALLWLENHFQDAGVTISLNHILVLAVMAERSQREHLFIKPRPHLTDKDLEPFRESEDEEVRVQKWTEYIDGDFPYKHITLLDAGVPPYHIIEVLSEGVMHHVLLSGDRPILQDWD